MTPNQLSEALLLAVKTNKSTDQLVEQLGNLSFKELTSSLQTDNHKKAFWINCYNAFFQLLSASGTYKPSIYRDKLVTIADHRFSLDEIEHGVIRRFRFKYALGFLTDPFASPLIRRLAVNKIDYRIHFALNCGAKSCPPIAFYNANKIDQQLDLATESFLGNDSEYDTVKKTLHVSKLFQWYHFDFGGKKGIKGIHQDLFTHDFSSFRIVYNPYSWEGHLSNFSE